YYAMRQRAKPSVPPVPILAEESMIRYASADVESEATFAPEPRSTEACSPSDVRRDMPMATDDTLDVDTETRVSRSAEDIEWVLPQIGRYVMIRELGRGGLGTVYLARDEALGREVAIKISVASLGARPEQRTRFNREALAMAQLKHPNIVLIYDV